MPWDTAQMKKDIEDSVAKGIAEGLKKAEPIAKAAEPVKAAEKPASKQVDLDETAVKVRKSNGYRFGADYTNICFGA